jgi:hypothetical protein
MSGVLKLEWPTPVELTEGTALLASGKMEEGLAMLKKGRDLFEPFKDVPGNHFADLSFAYVEALASDMRAGSWTLNPQPICFGADGRLQVVPLGEGRAEMPTALFFANETQSVLYGSEAMQAYLAGTEGLIGEAMQVALDAGIDHTAICAEHRGSLVRRMQCVHCKGISENVTTQPSQCAHCGLWLLVRDHYSRRLGAFQGVCIHAEEPANIPPAVETFV